MRLIVIMLLILICGSKKSQGQDYQGSIGLRGGVTNGITYKIFLMDEKSFEGIFSFRNNGIQLTGLVLSHEPVLFKLSDKLFLYKGIGMHVGYYGRHSCKGNRFHECNSNRYFSPNIGIDGMLGMEYRFLQLPLTIGLDYKPFIDVFGTGFFTSNFYDFAFVAKYTF